MDEKIRNEQVVGSSPIASSIGKSRLRGISPRSLFVSLEPQCALFAPCGAGFSSAKMRFSENCDIISSCNTKYEKRHKEIEAPGNSGGLFV